MNLKVLLSETNAKLYHTEKKLEEKVNSYKALMSRVRAWQQTERRMEKRKEKESQSEHNIPEDEENALKAQKVDLILTLNTYSCNGRRYIDVIFIR